VRKMRAGDLIFVSGHDLLSNTIRWFDPGQFSHVAVALSDTHLIESQYLTNVRIAEMDYEDYEIVDVGLSDSQRDQLVHLAIELVGKKYDYFFIIGLMFNERGWNHPNELICTEVAIDLFKTLNIIPHTDVSPVVKPNEFYRYVTVDLPKIKVYSNDVHLTKE
jgi:uncharacterized protein YycO